MKNLSYDIDGHIVTSAVGEPVLTKGEKAALQVQRERCASEIRDALLEERAKAFVPDQGELFQRLGVAMSVPAIVEPQNNFGKLVLPLPSSQKDGCEEETITVVTPISSPDDEKGERKLLGMLFISTRFAGLPEGMQPLPALLNGQGVLFASEGKVQTLPQSEVIGSKVLPRTQLAGYLTDGRIGKKL